MAGDCSIRALWILNNLDAVVFSRRFPAVEKRWRAACQSENESSGNDSVKYTVFSSLPSDSELAAAFSDRKTREGSVRGFDENLSSLLLDLPSITGAFMVAHAIGDIITGDVADPELNAIWNALGSQLFQHILNQG
ncbi:hypothetical protein V6N13_040634 [Hibiscus sabdariffa]